MKNQIILITVVTLLSGCAQVAQTAGRIDPRLGETANKALGIKNYRYDHVEGEPDQRLIIITGSSIYKRNQYRNEAVANACPKGTKPDVLVQKDDPKKSQMKVVVWCKK